MSSGDIKRLKEAGFNTVERIAHAMRSEIASVKGISEQKADKLLVWLLELLFCLAALVKQIMFIVHSDFMLSAVVIEVISFCSFNWTLIYSRSRH